MKRKERVMYLRDLAICALFALLGAAVAGNCRGRGAGKAAPPLEAAPETVRTVCVETVFQTRPRYVSRTVIRRDTVPARAKADTLPAAVLEVESRVYRDSSYTAWVSGVRPSLDSIMVTPATRREAVRIAVPAPPRRWQWGAQAGVGITPRGFLPYIGFGVGYRL